MASPLKFVTDLWQSIMTPGVTPVLVQSTHASFVALLFVLVGMLIYTHSIHFLILTIIASGLWGAITWFVAEIRKIELEKKELEGKSDKTDVINNLTEKPTDDESIRSATSTAVPKPSLTKTGSKKT